METPYTIGAAKRVLLRGEAIAIRIRPDGFCESDDLVLRPGLVILDLAAMKCSKPTRKETEHDTGNGGGDSCRIGSRAAG
jgi:hypothetical protein